MKLLVLILFMSVPVLGQRGSTDIRGTGGWTGFVDESSQDHLFVGASVRYYLTPKFSVEPEFQYLYNAEEDRDFVLLANVAYDFRAPGARVVPYVIGGLGMLWHRSSGAFGTFSANHGFASSGFGTKVYVNDRWFVSPEFRIGWEAHVRFTVSVGRSLGRTR